MKWHERIHWDAVSGIANVFAAAAVVLSLLYLAAQVRTSTRQAQLDASRELATRISETSLALATDRDLAGVFRRGSREFNTLNDDEQVLYRSYVSALYRAFEQLYTLRRVGALDNDTWTSSASMIHDFSSLPGVQRYLHDRGNWYGPSFREYLSNVERVPGIARGKPMSSDYAAPDTGSRK